MQARILTVGLDEALMETRAAILRRRYEVDLATPAVALDHLRKQSYALLLVCYSIPHDRGTALIREGRQAFPSIPIVRLLAADSPSIENPIADRVVTVDYRPSAWIEAVEELLAIVGR